jgi:probable addiction module antidote protein
LPCSLSRSFELLSQLSKSRRDPDDLFIAKALGDIARAKGMAQVARDAGLSRESLYKALSGERSPGFDTILKVIGALGVSGHPIIPRCGH